MPSTQTNTMVLPKVGFFDPSRGGMKGPYKLSNANTAAAEDRRKRKRPRYGASRFSTNCFTTKINEISQRIGALYIPSNPKQSNTVSPRLGSFRSNPRIPYMNTRNANVAAAPNRAGVCAFIVPQFQNIPTRSRVLFWVSKTHPVSTFQGLKTEAAADSIESDCQPLTANRQLVPTSQSPPEPAPTPESDRSPQGPHESAAQSLSPHPHAQLASRLDQG